jgi:hypothetical protein
MSIFAIWAIFLAARVQSRLLNSCDVNINEIFASLEVLHSAIESLKGNTGQWDGVIFELGSRLKNFSSQGSMSQSYDSDSTSLDIDPRNDALIAETSDMMRSFPNSGQLFQTWV